MLAFTMLTVLIGLLTLFTPLEALANEPPTEPIEISLEIDALELGTDVGPRLELTLHGPMGDMLKTQAFEVQGPGDAPMSIRTTLSYIDESNRTYAIHIDFIDEQGASTPLIEWFVCTACTERRLIEQTLAGFRLSTTRIHRVLAGAPSDIAPPPQLIPPTLTKPIGPLGYIGIGVGSAGLITAIVGTGIIASENSHNRSADVALGLGLSAVGFGIAAILGDVLHRRISSRRPHKPRIAPAPLQSGIAFSFAL